MDGTDPHKEDVRALIASYDEMVARVEATIARLEAELPAARASGDDRYLRRVERGLERSRALLALVDERMAPLLMDLRHNAHQLGVARDGKMV